MSLTLDMKALMAAAAFTGFDQTTPIRKIRRWRTEIVTYDSAIEQRGQILDQPIREWFVNWSLLDEAAQDQLREIFDAARGAFETFLWLDDKEYLAQNEAVVTDGGATSYQLQATYYAGQSHAWTEDKTAIVPGDLYPPVVSHSVDGAQTEVESSPGANQFTLDDTTGLLLFGAPPSAGVLTVTFQYYFRVRFTEDSFEDVQVYTGPLYAAPDLHLVEVPFE